MYSVLLTTVLTLNTATPEFGGLFRGRWGGNGCGGCYGCAGCFGCVGCFGGFGAPVAYSGGFDGLPLSYGGAAPFGPPADYGVGGPGVYGPGFGVYGPPAAPPFPAPGLGEMIAPQGVPGGPGETPPPPVAGAGGWTVPPDRALIVVTMPADGRLFADGQPIEGTGPLRVFQTPPLEPGKEYVYDMLMTVERGGKKLESKVPTRKFRAGERINVEFGEPGTGSSARFHIRMPEGGVLTVEGRLVALAAGTSFRTPALEPGRTYYYTLKLEVDRGGRKETLTREVSFRAGQEVAVDFADVSAGRIAKR
jgi:uncharacterized protein (TIGR03000 family)